MSGRSVQWGLFFWPHTFTVWLIVLGFACRRQNHLPMHTVSGYAQGTTFQVIYDSSAGRLEEEIRQIFSVMDAACSLYDSSSSIVRVNRAADKAHVDTLFASVFIQSRTIYEETGGAFNPAIYPLVRLWGFGPDGSEPQALKSIPSGDSLAALIRFEDFSLDTINGEIWCVKRKPFLQLDFNGIAQGYTVDLLCGLLESKGAKNYLVEVGGEVRARGLNPDGKPWRVGIEKPSDDNTERQIYAIANLSEGALATSGNYRKFYVKDGLRYSHTIDPFTGKPVSHNLLSVSVFTKTCARADALATAFMVMGNTRTLEWLRNHPDVDVYMISSGYQNTYLTYTSEGIKSRLEAVRN